MKRVAGLVFAAVLGAACMSGGEQSSPPTGAHVHWLLYGDSLSDGAAPYLRMYDTVGDRHRQSTAPCDWVGGLDGDPTVYSPDIVLLQFLGNPSCERGDREQAYEQDLTTIAQFWIARRVPVVMVLSPKTPTDDYAWARVAELRVADVLGLGVRNAGAAVEAPGEEFTYFLPCLATEGAAQGCGAELVDQIRVRASDGVHFGFSTPAYSAGAFRFAAAMAT